MEFIYGKLDFFWYKFMLLLKLLRCFLRRFCSKINHRQILIYVCPFWFVFGFSVWCYFYFNYLSYVGFWFFSKWNNNFLCILIILAICQSVIFLTKTDLEPLCDQSRSPTWRETPLQYVLNVNLVPRKHVSYVC